MFLFGFQSLGFHVSEFGVEDFLFQKQFSIIHASNILFPCSFVFVSLFFCLCSFVLNGK